jgi:type II secretory pathway component GspD/PulD (secretin)
VPFLGYIPLLGLLFSSEKETKISTDVVIFIEPVILGEAGKNLPEADGKLMDKAKEGIK